MLRVGRWRAYGRQGGWNWTWRGCHRLQFWIKEREWISLTGNRGANVRSQVSMRQRGIQVCGGKGALGENDMAVELLHWVCGAEIDGAG